MQRRQPALEHQRRPPGETVTCTFTNHKPGQIVVVKDAQPNDAQDFTFTAGGGLTPVELPARRRRRPHALEHARTFTNVAPRLRLLGLRDRAQRLGPGQRDLRRRQPGLEHRRRARPRPSPARSRTSSAARSSSSRTRSPTTRRTSASPPAAGSSPTSFQLDDDSDGTLSNTRTFTNVTPGTRLLDLRDGARAAGTSRAPPAATAARFEHQHLRRARPSPARSRTRSGARSWSCRTRCPTTRRTSTSRRAAACRPTSFQLDDHSNPTLPNTQHLHQPPGPQRLLVSQTVPSGWDLTSATCNDGSPVRTSTWAPGETVTCTFVEPASTARSRSSRTRSPTTRRTSRFTAGGGLSPASFQLDDDADGTLSNTRMFANVAAGHLLGRPRPVPAGWDQSSATCSDGSPVSDINIGAGENVTCTFTNQKRGADHRRQGRAAERPAGLLVHGGRRALPASFSLDDDSDRTLSNTRTFNDVAGRAAATRCRETRARRLGAVERDLQRRQPGRQHQRRRRRDVTCTFTNQQARPDRGRQGRQPDDPQDFSFTAGGGLCRRASRSTTTPTGRSRTRATFSNVRARLGLLGLRDRARAAGTRRSATCDDGSPVSNIDVAPARTSPARSPTASGGRSWS